MIIGARKEYRERRHDTAWDILRNPDVKLYLDLLTQRLRRDGGTIENEREYYTQLTAALGSDPHGTQHVIETRAHLERGIDALLRAHEDKVAATLNLCPDE